MTFLKESDMLGPTDEARALQLMQFKACDKMYDAWSAAIERHGRDNTEAVNADSEFSTARTAYETTVTQLEQLLGTDAHCNYVDSDLWSLFSDCYKSDNNFRPRMQMTRVEVQAWLDQRRAVPA
jgi:hypothetical protein